MSARRSSSTGLVALHPQLAFVATSASPDALVNFAGTIVWRQAAVLLSSGLTMADLAVLWVAGAGAFLIRRMGAPLLVVAAAVTLIVTWRDIPRTRVWRAVPAAGLAALVLLAIAAPAIWTDWSRALGWIQFDPERSLSTTVENAAGLPRFLDALFRTFWLSAGWLQYGSPAWWRAVAIGMALIAGFGLIRLAASEPRKAALWLCGFAVVLQVAAVVAYHFGILQGGAQGRYLFPVLPAILCLLWLGWQRAVGGGERPRLAAVSILLVMAFLNASGWLFVVFPAYA